MLICSCSEGNEAALCDHIIDNDKKAVITLERFLKTNSITNKPQQFENIRTWLLSHKCIKDVVIEAGYKRSDPPLKVFVVKVNKSNGQTIEKIVSVSVEPNGMKIESIK